MSYYAEYAKLALECAKILGAMDMAIARGELPEYLEKHHKALEDALFPKDMDNAGGMPLAPVYDITTGVLIDAEGVSNETSTDHR